MVVFCGDSRAPGGGDDQHPACPCLGEELFSLPQEKSKTLPELRPGDPTMKIKLENSPLSKEKGTWCLKSRMSA